MKDFINNEKWGYVIVNLKTQTIDDVLKNIYTGPDEKLLLVDGNKELLSSSDGLDAHVYEQDFKNHLNFSGDSGIYVEKSVGRMFKLLIIGTRKQIGISFRGFRYHL